MNPPTGFRRPSGKKEGASNQNSQLDFSPTALRLQYANVTHEGTEGTERTQGTETPEGTEGTEVTEVTEVTEGTEGTEVTEGAEGVGAT